MFVLLLLLQVHFRYLPVEIIQPPADYDKKILCAHNQEDLVSMNGWIVELHGQTRDFDSQTRWLKLGTAKLSDDTTRIFYTQVCVTDKTLTQIVFQKRPVASASQYEGMFGAP